MDRIVLLMQEKKSAGLMRDRLANNYQVLETEIDQSLDFSFDLGIVDESALKQSWEEVQSRKEAAKPVFLPFLLVAARRNADFVTRHLWQTVDEIIWIPDQSSGTANPGRELAALPSAVPGSSAPDHRGSHNGGP